MTRRHDFDDQLRAWAELGDERLPADHLNAALAQIERTPQRRSLAGWRFPQMNHFARLAMAATALVVVLLIGIKLIQQSPDVGPSPTPGPTDTASLEPSATAEPSQQPAAWSAAASMIQARYGFSATRLADGRVLVAGGSFDNSHRGQAAAELYDPATGTWTATGSMLAGRYRHSATLLNDGRVLVAGGNASDSGASAVRCCLATAELYDPSTGTWAATGSMIDIRVEFAAVLLNDGRVLVAGGDNAAPNGSTPRAELYDPRTGTWAATGAMQLGTYANQAALLANGKVLVVGGTNRNAPPELYDPSSGTWSTLDCPDGRIPVDNYCRNNWRVATALPDGTVLVVAETRDAALYDPRAGTWSPTRPPKVENPERAVLLLSGSVLVLSVDDLGDPAAQLYDPSSGTWTAVDGPSAFRFGAVPTLLPDGGVLLLGGLEDRGFTGLWPVATAELYDPAGGS